MVWRAKDIGKILRFWFFLFILELEDVDLICIALSADGGDLYFVLRRRWGLFFLKGYVFLLSSYFICLLSSGLIERFQVFELFVFPLAICPFWEASLYYWWLAIFSSSYEHLLSIKTCTWSNFEKWNAYIYIFVICSHKKMECHFAHTQYYIPNLYQTWCHPWMNDGMNGWMDRWKASWKTTTTSFTICNICIYIQF
jgi:hypothetical protein